MMANYIDFFHIISSSIIEYVQWSEVVVQWNRVRDPAFKTEFRTLHVVGLSYVLSDSVNFYMKSS
jgi:hypothetical protein